MSDYFRGLPTRDLSEPVWRDAAWVSRMDALSEKLRVSTAMVSAGVSQMTKMRLQGADNESIVEFIYKHMQQAKEPLIGPRYADEVEIPRNL